jgi:site-specific DNA recombinase
VTRQSIIYTRVSTDEQAEKGYSLPHQVSECRRYAMLNGFSVLAEITDDYSGATLERPGFSQLREIIIQNQVDAIIVYTADRLSRNIIDFLVLRDQWEKAGIELHYVDRGKSQNNFEGLLTDGIFALIAHGERLKIIERTTNGRHNKAKSNRVVMTGITPYGYKRRGQGHEAEYVIDPFESEVIKNIFEWYVNGYENKGPLSLRVIATLLDDMGIEPPNQRPTRKARVWYPNGVARILSNPIYTGLTYYGKLKNENGKRIRRPKEEWTAIKVPHLALVSTEMFEQAQKRALHNKDRAKWNRKRPYLMSGHFRCGTCGYVMCGIFKKFPNGGGKSYYRCFRTNAKRGVCNGPKKQVPVVRIDTAVWEWVTSLLEDENNLDEGIRAMIEKKEREWGPKQERLGTLEGLLLGADAKIERLVDELSEYGGLAVRDVIREKIRTIESERNMLAGEWERISQELEQNDILPDFEKQIKKTAAIIREKLSGATIEDKQMVLDALDMQVQYLYSEERGEILKISCVIPFADGQIVLHPSRDIAASRKRGHGANGWIIVIGNQGAPRDCDCARLHCFARRGAYVSATSQYTPIAPSFFAERGRSSFSGGAPDGWESARF